MLDKQKYQALHAFCLACSPKISWGTFESMLDFASEVGIVIDGKILGSKSKVLKALLPMYASKPIHFREYFMQIYSVLARESKGTPYEKLFTANALNAPQALQVAAHALKFHLSRLENPLEWAEFQDLVRESISLGVNRHPNGISTKYTKRMDKLLQTYMRDAVEFDQLLEWLRVETRRFASDPTLAGLKEERKRLLASYRQYSQRLQSIIFRGSAIQPLDETMPSDQVEFEDYLAVRHHVSIHALVNKAREASYLPVSKVLAAFDAHRQGYVSECDDVVREILHHYKPKRYARNMRGDAWDTADHWGWYF